MRMGRSCMGRPMELAHKEVVSTTQESTRIVEMLPTTKLLERTRTQEVMGLEGVYWILQRPLGFCNRRKEEILEGRQLQGL